MFFLRSNEVREKAQNKRKFSVQFDMANVFEVTVIWKIANLKIVRCQKMKTLKIIY